MESEDGGDVRRWKTDGKAPSCERARLGEGCLIAAQSRWIFSGVVMACLARVDVAGYVLQPCLASSSRYSSVKMDFIRAGFAG